MRNPARINKVLEKVRKIWHMYPDLRLAQLINNCRGDNDAYYMEDEELLKRLDEVYTNTQK